MSVVVHYLKKNAIPSDVYRKQNLSLLTIRFSETKGRSLLAHESQAYNPNPKYSIRASSPVMSR